MPDDTMQMSEKDGRVRRANNHVLLSYTVALEAGVSEPPRPLVIGCPARRS